MRRNPRLFRLTSSVAVGALLWDAAWPLAAMAQPAPPPLPPAQGQPDQNQADPPARVGRVAAITGTVSFHNAGDTQWSTASVNYPVSSGNAFWTEPSAETQLEISDSRIALAGGSEFDVYALDASGLQGVAALGETYFRLRDLAPNEMWSVQTPRGLVHLGGAGRYGIVVGTTEQPTLVTVLEGSAQIEGPGVSLQVGAGQTATISGTDSFQGSVGPAVRDAFLTERLNAERPPPALASVPAQVAVMPGGADLYGVGSWSPAPEYGQVWYPPVSPGWVPYREGHWAYVAPWGWTWIDNAPWGFAPFHYGRWLQIDGRWGWTPGEAAVAGPPVYAPALVAFIGIGAGVALGAALASGSIGWVPLGPREPFRPWYHCLRQLCPPGQRQPRYEHHQHHEQQHHHQQFRQSRGRDVNSGCRDDGITSGASCRSTGYRPGVCGVTTHHRWAAAAASDSGNRRGYTSRRSAVVPAAWPCGPAGAGTGGSGAGARSRRHGFRPSRARATGRVRARQYGDPPGCWWAGHARTESPAPDRARWPAGDQPDTQHAGAKPASGCGAWCSSGRVAADGTASGAPGRTCSRARRTPCRNAPAPTADAPGGAAGASSGPPAAASRASGRRPARSPTAARGATCRTPST